MRPLLRLIRVVAFSVCLLFLFHPRAWAQTNPTCSFTYGTNTYNNACVWTHGYDNDRDNVNIAEPILTPSSVGSISATVSPVAIKGAIFAEPLYVYGLTIGANSPQNVVYAATEENYVYALDENSLNYITGWTNNPVNLNGSGESAIPDGDLLPTSCGDIFPEVGITGTPVIDLVGDSIGARINIMYVVTTVEQAGPPKTFTQRLTGLSIVDGSVAVPAIDIPTAFSNAGYSFNANMQNQRAGLALSHDYATNPLVYVSWGSHCDHTSAGYEYHGLVAVFQVSPPSATPSFSLLSVFDDEAGSSATAPRGGIWMAAATPAIDESQTQTSGSGSKDVYLASGNGDFVYNATPPSAYGDSVLQLQLNAANTSFAPLGFYTPEAWQVLNNGSGSGCAIPLTLPPPNNVSFSTVCISNDFDFGTGGVNLARPQGLSLPDSSFVVLTSGKEGVVYVVDPSQMPNSTGADSTDPCTQGGSGSVTLQCFSAAQLPAHNLETMGIDYVGLRGGQGFWPGNNSTGNAENWLYTAGNEDPYLRAYQMVSGGTFYYPSEATAAAPLSDGTGFPYPAASPVVTWDYTYGSNSGALLWVLATWQSQPSKHAGLFAYAALPASHSLGSELFSDTANGPFPTKFSEPTIAHGHVFAAGVLSPPSTYCTAAGSCTGTVVEWH